MLLRPASMSWLKTCYFAVILALIVSTFAPQVLPVQASSVSAPPHAPSAVTALQFNGTNQYVTFGAAPSLGLATFTVEAWFRRDGTGATTTTGTGGVTSAIPLVTKGRGEAEGSNVDMNYFLGINNTNGVIAADFEDMATGGNHPVNGVTVIQNGVWYHAAATYDGTTWRLYLNGNLEATTAANATPRSDSIQHAAIGSAQTSTGVAAGFFNGAIDEARIWNYARTQQEIQDNLGQEVSAGTGLVARWGMNEGSGTTINGTGSGVVQGTLTNGPTWVTGTPFQLTAIFQEGLNGYAGTVDTFLRQSQPGTAQGTATTVDWDTEETAGNPNTQKIGLLRFDNIFGSGITQVPIGANIISATVQYVVANVGDAANVNEVLINWTEAETYNSFGGEAGVQADEYGTLIGSATAPVAGTYILTVTSSINIWANSPTANLGWIFRPTATDGVQIQSSENTTTAQRPTLRVVYTLTPPDTTPPAAPTGLTATTSDGQINLTWTANTEPDLAGYNVYRSTTSPVPTTSPINGGALVTNPSYTDTGLINGTTYYYVVTAVDTSANQSAASNEVNAVFTATTVTVTFQEGVNGYGSTIDTFVREEAPTTEFSTANGFEWDADTTGGQDEIALVRFDNIFGSNPGQIPAGMTILSATLQYRVSSDANAEGDSASVYESLVNWAENVTWNTFGGDAGVQADEYANFVTTAPATALSTVYVIDLTASLQRWSNNPSTNLGWVFIPPGTNGIKIWSSEYTTVADRPRLQVIYSTIPPTPPAAPTGLSAVPTIGSQIDLQWTDNATNETNFEIERSTTGSGGPFSLLTSVGANVTTYQDSGLTANAEYCYQVRATNGGGDSAYTNVGCATTPVNPNNALDFGNGNAYVTFGDNATLRLSQFTLETWFRRDGTGTTANTGSGGVDAIPLIAKGMHESDNSNVDANYILGIRGSDNVLVADFEEGAGGTSPGLNHPVAGITPIQTGMWYHAAVTYDGTTWRLYLNGNLETQLTVGQPVRSDSIQHAGLGVALNSTGTAEGHFDGVLDEARIWNSARPIEQIRATINSEIATPQTGLVARWSLNEGSGTVVNGSAGTTVNGTINGSNYAWVPGAPFNIVINDPPDAPTLNAPSNGSTVMTVAPTLSVNVSDPDTTDLTVTFYGRAVGATSNQTFTLVALPDTQFYSESYPQIFISQTQWIVDNLVSRNIVYVAHEGDIVNVATNTGQWNNADAAMDLLDPAGIPYGVVPGNHDDSDGGTNYNSYFGVARFTGKSFYGGEYPVGDNQNNYTLFSAGGMDFIVINLDYTSPVSGSLTWADGLLKTYSTRRAIVVSHNIVNTGNPAPFDSWGQSIYDELKDNPNLFLMLCGHVSGEGQRTDVYSGSTVYSLLADYQSRSNGGDGWLRILEFSPANNQIRVKTYSPTLNQYEIDADSQFTLAYTFTVPFQPIGTVNATSGSTANLVWPNLSNNTQYEWYAVVNDGNSNITGSTNNFTVGDFAFADNDDVCAGNEPCYPTIQDALNHVSSGLVTVYDGVYNEPLTLNKNATVSIANNAVINLIGAFNMSAGTFNAGNGTLNLSGDFTYSGGTFNAGTGSIGFNGGTTQNLNLNVPIVFKNLTVGSGTTLIETSSADNATVNGTLSNSGTLRKIKAIGGGGSIGLGLTGVQMDVTTPGSLTSLQVDRIDSDHPNATPPLTGKYWSITPTGSGYAVVLTLPHNGLADPKVCKYPGGLGGSGWDCARDSFTPSTVTRSGITSFSDWAVGEAGPTALEVMSLSASSADRSSAWPWLLAYALLGGGALLVLVIWVRRMNQHH